MWNVSANIKNECIYLRVPSVALLSIALASGFGCAKKTNRSQPSGISIQFPSASEYNKANPSEKTNAASATAADATLTYGLFCFAVNVTASDLKSPPKSSCDVPIGIFAGPVPPGGSLTLEIPNGRSRQLDVIGFLRTNTTDPCPTIVGGNFGQFDRSKMFKLGSVSSFDTLDPVVNVDVSIQMPTASQSLYTQNAMPATCQFARTDPITDPNGPSGKNVARIRSAIDFNMTGGTLMMNAKVGRPNDQVLLTGGTLQMRLERK